MACYVKFITIYSRGSPGGRGKRFARGRVGMDFSKDPIDVTARSHGVVVGAGPSVLLSPDLDRNEENEVVK
jgi:hypothetical protein